MWHKIALSLWSVAVMLLFFSCKENFSEKNREEAVLVRIGDKALTSGDLEREIPDRLKSKDSALFADNYIKQWVDYIFPARKNPLPRHLRHRPFWL